MSIGIVRNELAMRISQKCQYALRATFELAKRYGQGPIKVSDIGEAQAIPVRFLEVILNQLKRAGFVESKRGAAGGYVLAKPPPQVAMSEIIHFVEGPLQPVSCLVGNSDEQCPLHGDCVFLGVWDEARKAMSEVFEHTTFQDLIDREKAGERAAVSSYCI